MSTITVAQPGTDAFVREIVEKKSDYNETVSAQIIHGHHYWISLGLTDHRPDTEGTDAAIAEDYFITGLLWAAGLLGHPKLEAQPGDDSYTILVINEMTDEGRQQVDAENEAQRLLEGLILQTEPGPLDSGPHINVLVDLVNTGIHYVRGYLK